MGRLAQAIAQGGDLPALVALLQEAISSRRSQAHHCPAQVNFSAPLLAGDTSSRNRRAPSPSFWSTTSSSHEHRRRTRGHQWDRARVEQADAEEPALHLERPPGSAADSRAWRRGGSPRGLAPHGRQPPRPTGALFARPEPSEKPLPGNADDAAYLQRWKRGVRIDPTIDGFPAGPNEPAGLCRRPVLDTISRAQRWRERGQTFSFTLPTRAPTRSRRAAVASRASFGDPQPCQSERSARENRPGRAEVATGRGRSGSNGRSHTAGFWSATLDASPGRPPASRGLPGVPPGGRRLRPRAASQHPATRSAVAGRAGGALLRRAPPSESARARARWAASACDPERSAPTR